MYAHPGLGLSYAAGTDVLPPWLRLFKSLFVISTDNTALDSSVMGILGLILSGDICSSAFAAWFDVAVSTPFICIDRATMPVLRLDREYVATYPELN